MLQPGMCGLEGVAARNMCAGGTGSPERVAKASCDAECAGWMVLRRRTCVYYSRTYRICTQVGLEKDWVLSRWDGAHRMELGMDTVRKVVKYYFELAGIVASAQSKYMYGKNYARVKQYIENMKLKLAAVGTICTTRFCGSERRVYKNFFANLHAFITDMDTTRTSEIGVPKHLSLHPVQCIPNTPWLTVLPLTHAKQLSAALRYVNEYTGISHEVAKVKTVVFVVRLAGTIDVLAHVKNLSLLLQMVNVLPWELEQEIEKTLALIETLGAQLKRGRVDHTLPPNVCCPMFHS